MASRGTVAACLLALLVCSFVALGRTDKAAPEAGGAAADEVGKVDGGAGAAAGAKTDDGAR